MNTVAAMGSFAVKDIDQALKFYKEILGLNVTKDQQMGMMNIKLPAGGTLLVYPKGSEHQPANFTVLNILVTDIESAVDELAQKGVKFEQYDTEYIKTDAKGIARDDTGNGASAIAWFTDPDGNILSIIEDSSVPK